MCIPIFCRSFFYSFFFFFGGARQNSFILAHSRRIVENQRVATLARVRMRYPAPMDFVCHHAISRNKIEETKKCFRISFSELCCLFLCRVIFPSFMTTTLRVSFSSSVVGKFNVIKFPARSTNRNTKKKNSIDLPPRLYHDFLLSFKRRA